MAEGLDPEAYRDPSWSNEASAVDKLYPAVVLAVTKDLVTVRLYHQRIELGPAAWAWTKKKTLDGVLKRGDLIHVLQQEDAKTKERKWVLDQMPSVQGAVVVLDVKSGEVLALVGGYDFAHSKFNRAVQSRRQTGSSFKPFVYGAAFEKGLTPADTLFDAPIAIPVGEQTYAPKNYYGKYAGIVTIQRALELSINVPAVKTYIMTGGDRVVDFARRLGITADLPKYPSLALGAAGVSPLQMTGAYNVFANSGRLHQAALHPKDRRPDRARARRATARALRGHVAAGGVRDRLHDEGDHRTAAPRTPRTRLADPLAGKTGTTNGYTDAWFIGFSPEYTVSVWAGYGRSLQVARRGSDRRGRDAADLDRHLQAVRRAEAPHRQARFRGAAGVVIVPMDLTSGRRGVGPCARVVMQAFVAGQEPDKDCNGAGVQVAKLPYYLQRPMYQAKEGEPTQPANDASAQSGESAESPAPATDTPAVSDTPPVTST